MKRHVFALVCLAAAACGSGPAAPALPGAFTLSAGAYTLNISVWQTISSNPYGFTRSELVCVGRGATSASLRVTVAREGNAWVARTAQGELTLTLNDAATGYKGWMLGSAAEGGVAVSVDEGGIPNIPARLPETASSPTSIGGRIEGSVRFVNAQGEQSCSNNAWALTARQ